MLQKQQWSSRMGRKTFCSAHRISVFSLLFLCVWLIEVVGEIYPFAPGVRRRTGVYIEKWDGIDTYSIDAFRRNERFPYLPTWRGYGSHFTQPSNWGENFGSRIRAYFVPKQTGAHVFYISSDNGARLYLSKDELPDHKSLIAQVADRHFTAPGEYDKYPEQQSWPVPLEKGKYYFIETLMKELFDTDHLSVAFKGPDGTFHAPIGSEYLWTATVSETDYKHNKTAQWILIRYAARYGARAGATSGDRAASVSGAKAGRDAGALAGERAGAEAGAQAAAKAARKIITTTINNALKMYKNTRAYAHAIFMSPGHHVTIKEVNTQTGNAGTVSITQTGGAGRGNNKQTGSAEASSNLQNGSASASTGSAATALTTSSSGSSSLPGVTTNQETRVTGGATDHLQKYRLPGVEPDREGTPFGSRGVAIPTDTVASQQAAIQFAKLQRMGGASNVKNVKNSNKGVKPVFESLMSGNSGNATFVESEIGSQESRESTRERAKFVYYPKKGEDPDEVARKLVYDDGTASKVVFNAHYSIHSLDVPAIQINLTKNLCFRSVNSHVTLRGACQFFIIREGLLPMTNSDDFSLQSACVPDHYIVQKNYRFFLAKHDGSLHFAREATFAFYKIMSFPSALQIMSFYHYLWFTCEDKRKNNFNTGIHLEYNNPTNEFLERCSFNFLPMPSNASPTMSCKGVLDHQPPKIPGQSIKEGRQRKLKPNETCIALRFINMAHRPVVITSDLKDDSYLITSKDFKLKTVIRRPQLHHHITFKAFDPTREKAILLFGDNSITLQPLTTCDDYIPVEVTASAGVKPPSPSYPPTTEQPSLHVHYHYHPPAAPTPTGCPVQCTTHCLHFCPPNCCKTVKMDTARDYSMPHPVEKVN
ncbi:uncharacterized protein LOC116610679 [Nematostella vectensis]|uniref:uncharacterized protein LOC116610679 n=1 Tax=Nematostella vectensis TaxID=45351 RepID=UPI002076D66A|nr:uncharacterized protein LOC116610679 [Nematostella vectensis]